MKYINYHLIIFMITALIIMPLLTAEILRLLGNHTKQQLVNNYGMNSQVAFGGLGVIIHELAHLLTACVFLHRIGHFKLLEPKAYQYTGNLGYVKHYWNRGNLYESLGNFFIGLAPCFGCSGCLWLIHGFLFDNQVYNSNSVHNLSSAIQIAMTNVMHPFGQVSWQLLIYLILIVMVASTGYGLSDADVHGTLSGLPYWIGFLVIVYLLVISFNAVTPFILFLWKLVILWLTFLGRGLIYLLISLSIIDGISYII